MGVTCTTPPDPCQNHQCLHGGTCVPGGASNYTCACPAGYTGDRCDLIPVPGGWGDWTTWGNCSASCGDGVRSRQRLCNNPAPRYGGQDCNGADTETQGCSGVLCAAANVTWGEWDEWSVCSATCGGGTRTRQRSCTEGDKQNATGCVGVHEKEEVCATSSCPVHGGWSEWADQSACSVTCGLGQKARERTCTNPLPGNGGSPCSGIATENLTCNVAACRVCTSLRRSIGTLLRCEQLESPYLKVCNLTCAPGYVSPSETFPQCKCGEETNFIWSHQMDMESDAELPSCNTPSFPSRAALTQHVTMTTDCDPETVYKVQSGVASNIQSTVPCTISSGCHTQLTTSCSNGGTNREKRGGGLLIINLNITLDLSAFANTSTNDTNSTQKFTELLQLAGTWADAITMNDTEKLFTVNIGGVEIKPDLGSVNYTSDLYCPSGSIPHLDFCVVCSAGYKEVSGECVRCPLGQYQDQLASTVCKDCPGDTTWHLLGAVSITQCIVPLNTPVASERNEEDTPLSHTTVIIIAVIVCVTVLLCAVVAAVAICKYKQPNRPQHVIKPNARVCPLPEEGVGPLSGPEEHPPSYSDAMELKAMKLDAWEDATTSAAPDATFELDEK